MAKIAVTITMSRFIKQTAQKRADLLGQSLGEYLTQLIHQDNQKLIDAFLKEQMQTQDTLNTRQTTFEEIKPTKKTPKKEVRAKQQTPKEPPKQISIDADTSDYITPHELANILQVSDRAIQKRLAKGTIQGYKDNRQWLIPKTEIERLKSEKQ